MPPSVPPPSAAFAPHRISPVASFSSLAPLAIAAIALIAACKPASTKATVGPFSVDRYDATTPDGAPLACYLFGGESNKPVRLCGDGGPIPGYAGALFEAVAPAPDSKFAAAVGPPLEPGTWLLRVIGSNSVDAWNLGHFSASLWLGGGKLLFAVESGKPLKLRLVNPAARSDRVLDPGPTSSEAFLLVRAPDDKSLLLVTRAGADDLLIVRDPMGNADVSASEANDTTLAGNRKLAKHAEDERQRGSVYRPSVGSFSWNGADPLFEGSPLGPFTPVVARH